MMLCLFLKSVYEFNEWSAHNDYLIESVIPSFNTYGELVGIFVYYEKN